MDLEGQYFKRILELVAERYLLREELEKVKDIGQGIEDKYDQLHSLAEKMADAGEKLQQGNWHGSTECDDRGDPHYECVCGLQDARESWFEVSEAWKKWKGGNR